MREGISAGELYDFLKNSFKSKSLAPESIVYVECTREDVTMQAKVSITDVVNGKPALYIDGV